MKHLERYEIIAKLAHLVLTSLAQQDLHRAILALTQITEVAEQSMTYCAQLNLQHFFEPENGEVCKPNP